MLDHNGNKPAGFVVWVCVCVFSDQINPIITQQATNKLLFSLLKTIVELNIQLGE